MLFDEFAFVQGAGSTATSTDIYQAATPATLQFSGDRLIVQASSAWEKTGQLYASYQRGLQIDPSSGNAKDPATLVLQLPSWDLYRHHEPAESIPMWPGGPTFCDQKPIITEAMVTALEDRGEDVSVEYHAQFASSPHAYLYPDRHLPAGDGALGAVARGRHSGGDSDADEPVDGVGVVGGFRDVVEC